MNVAEFVDFLNESNIDTSDFVNNDFYEGDVSPKGQVERKFGLFTEVYNKRIVYDGEQFERTIYYFKDHQLYLGIDGWYGSYRGTDYSDSVWYEAKAIQEVVYVPKD